MKHREIKFRGKRTDTGEWVYGSLLHDKTLKPGDRSEYTIWSNEGDRNWYDVEPETVCQFTGLTDKYGVEIYEGDYLVDRYKEDGKWKELLLEVQWCPKSLQWAVDVSFKQDGSFLANLVDYFTFNELEVNGNVFENPKNEEK